MQHHPFEGTAVPEVGLDTRDRFNVVILYDGAEAGRRAMGQLRKVTDHLESEFDLRVGLWRLDMAMDAVAGDTAAAEVAGADLLLLSLDDEASVSARANKWLAEAVHRKQGQGAAVAVLGVSAMAGSTSRFDFLRLAAKEAGLGFLFPPAGSAPAGNESPFTAVQLRATATTPVLDGILRASHSQPFRKIMEDCHEHSADGIGASHRPPISGRKPGPPQHRDRWTAHCRRAADTRALRR